MTVRHIDHAERRRRLVNRQFLDPHGRSQRSAIDVVDAIGLLHATDPSTPYLTIAARSGADRNDIDALLYDERELLRHTTIRRTVFVMPNRVVPLAHGAYNTALVAKLRAQLVRWLDASSAAVEGAALLERAEVAVVDRLRTDGPASGTTLAKELDLLRTSIDPAPGKSYSKPIRITSKVLEILVADGRIARGRPTGDDFTSGAWTWESIEGWFPDGIDPVDPTDALAGLLTGHLSSFGPATVTDLAWWAGLAKGKIKTALTAIGAESVSLDGGEEGFVLADDQEPEPEREQPAVVLLPGLDPSTMGWKQRDWYVDDAAATGIFDRNGNAGPTIWVDGRVVGVWTQRSDGRIVTEFSEVVGSEHVRRCDVEAERLQNWLDDVRVNWRYPTPLTKHLEA